MNAEFKVYRAPAKINLCLHVLGRRMDGYHEVAMIMQAVSLYDVVRIRCGGQPGIRVSCSGVLLPQGEANIAEKAARLLLNGVVSPPGVDIEIEKHIPVAAGLGGGSSNAATVLLALNEMLNLGYSRGELQEFGSRLGADVPFFVFGSAAWATGTGIQLEEIPPLPRVAYLLVNPGIAVSTAEVYQSLQLTRGGELANLPRFSILTRSDLCRALKNDLEPVTLARYPVIETVKQALLDLGAAGALMSGSGSTVFAVFDDFAAAAEAGEALKGCSDWSVFPVEPL
ncbi:MAG: 4-(cytidine 5'-diphospho)-2-C-methyl-D-erythritol kinase [Desulfuromonadales bacterium]|nr:4-(cytidine 5'-diphospho)-2-C-methyl-D-erythritol kinase [Desulfuromonadales bacterium]MBN2792780.1 4-(cytidine 5'-diphospho)-2-C-methyl-D-erythritol kinase [Desulfuromonadales bacterium]